MIASYLKDYQPSPDFNLAPRLNVHFPEGPVLGCAEGQDGVSQGQHRVGPGPLPAGDRVLPGLDAADGRHRRDARARGRGADRGQSRVREPVARRRVGDGGDGPRPQPLRPGYSAGGSSSGTAALVASGAVDLGIGCDQGGSVRIPAAMCGLYGFKPTFGLVPYTGIASNDASVDFVGPMTRTCLECATLLEVLAGADGLDDRQGAGCPFPGQVPRYADELRASGVDGAKGLRIGILKEGLEGAAMNDAVKAKFLAAAEVFSEKLGAASVEEVSVPMHATSRLIYSVLSKMGNHMGMLGRATGRRQVMLTDLAARKNLPYTQAALGKMSAFSHEGLLAGELGWSQYPLAYGKAVNLTRRLRDDYDAALERYDVLLLPTTLRASFPLPPADAGPVAHMDAGRGMTENTASFNGTGHPALAVPIGFVPSEADPSVMVPTSMQIVGRFWDEMTVLKAAYAWEQSVDWKSF
ncbi:hypothetical protein PG991_004516 [Apiospora marii]|uniref:Amidase domain-containing protein n=1 Tax=Apiospora marii TaxID=335849 RepID=A0ABR1S6J6_9PEZI